MNRRGNAILKWLAGCGPVIVLLCTCLAAGAQNSGVLIIRLRNDASINRVARDYGLDVLDSVQGRNVYEVEPFDPNSLSDTEAYLQVDRRVVYCEEEAGISLPEVFGGPFHLAFGRTPNPVGYKNQSAFNQVNLPVSSLISGLANVTSAVTVAVLDTGANITHPSLQGSLVEGYNTLSPGADPLDLPDGVVNSAVGHGTMIAGIVAIAAPDAVIMPIRVLNADGTGTLMNVLQGLNYAVIHGAQVINMSFGSPVESIALKDAVYEAHRAGIVLVSSAGNDSTNAPQYPASWPIVLGVGSVEPDNTLSSFSNFGVNVSVVAPGDGIASTYWDGGYASWSGTSFAAPFVSAEAAEIASIHPNWSPAHISRRIMRTADNIDLLNPGFETQLGAGIIDIQAAETTQGNGGGRGH